MRCKVVMGLPERVCLQLPDLSALSLLESVVYARSTMLNCTVQTCMLLIIFFE